MSACPFSVIVPTYCEAQNLPELVQQIDDSCRRFSGYEIVVVDDDSPDETVAVCRQLEDRFPVRLIVRKNARGLSSAVIHGMETANGEVFVVMDADLSHPPSAVPDLVAAVTQQGADFAVGSRYVDGGEVEEGWGLGRWLNSRVATLLASPLTSVRDPMAGFFAVHRRSVAEAAPLTPKGYKIGLELLVKCDCRNVVEIPIQFRDRIHGESKLSMREQVNYVEHLASLYAYRFFGRRAA